MIAAEVSADPIPPDYSYQFLLPGDMNRMVAVLDVDERPIAFERIGNRIYASEAPVVLRYVVGYNATSGNEVMPDDFAEVLANYLAADICVSLTQNQSLRDTYLSEYNRLLTEARFNGAIELPPQAFEATEWLQARESFSSASPSTRGLAGY